MRILGGAVLSGDTDAARLRGGGSTVHAMFSPPVVLIVGIGLGQLLRVRPVVAGAVAIAAGALVAGWYFASETMAVTLTAMAAHVATLPVQALASRRVRMPAAGALPCRNGEGH